MKSVNNTHEALSTRMKKGSKNCFLWTLSWLISIAIVRFGPEYIWGFNTLLTLPALGISTAIGFGMIIANKNYILSMDEMQQKIHFNAMAICLGVTLVLGALLGLLEPTGLVGSAPSASNVLFIMGMSYLVGIVLNHRKYA